MKKFTAALLAAALALPGMAAPAMAQQQHSTQQHSSQTQNHGTTVSKTAKKTSTKTSYKTFKKGEKFDKSKAKSYQVVDYRKYSKLPAPKKGYRYVRAGNDVLLIGTTSLKVYMVYSGLIR